jgi:hypothetical protein
MKLDLKRFSTQNDSTLGLLFVNGEFECFVLEDEYRDIKVKGETRIPCGFYDIKKRQVLSGLTKKYRAKFDWFDYHFQLQDVPNFNYVYLHIGNDTSNTDGCLLLNNGIKSNAHGRSQKNLGTESTSAFKRLYQKMSKNDNITINITDNV